MNNFFLGIGVAKAGTSWLGDYFNKHPEVCFSPVKEIHYFDTIFLKFVSEIKLKRIENLKQIVNKIDKTASTNTIFNLKQHIFLIEMFSNPLAYHNYFNWLKKKNETICGEITPEYSLLNNKGLKHMRDFLNSPKIILMLRNPVDRQWSQVRFHKKFIPNLIFKEYFLKSFQLKRFAEWSNYHELLPKLFSVFKKEEVHIIFYEDLFDKEIQSSILKNLCKFLEISYIAPDFQKKINASTENELSSELRLIGINKLKPSYEFVYNHFGNIPNSWTNDLKSINNILNIK